MDASAQPPNQQYRFADLVLDVGQYRVRRGDESIALAKLTFELLRVLVEAAPNLVTHAELAEKVWGPRHVVTPETLAKRVMLLRRALGDDADNPTYIEGVRQQGYRLVPTVEAMTAESQGDKLVSLRTANKRIYLAATIGVLVLATIFVAQNLLSTRSAITPASPNSVAVLPFVNLSGNAENEYFSDGLTETVLHMLAQNPNLRVVARTSSFAFKDRNMDVREISEQLGVAHVLEGSVQQDGSSIRVTTQLIRASDGMHLWSERYDRQLVDIFVIHDDIAVAVGSELSKSLVGNLQSAPPQGLATDNVDALDLYLQALPEFAVGSFESLQKADRLLKNALVQDPNFTDAKIKLAENYIRLFDTGVMPLETGLPIATALFEQALTERPGDPVARAYLAEIKVYRGADSGDIGVRIASVDEFRKIVDDAPNNLVARQLLARALSITLNFEDAIEEYQTALSIDPLNPETHYFLALTYRDMQNWESARREYKRSLELLPLQPSIASELAELNLVTGDAVGYVREMQDVIEMDPLDHEYPYAIAKMLYELELIDEGDRFAAQVLAIAPNSPAAQDLQIVRSIRADEPAASAAVARRLIGANADDRRNAWLRAFKHLVKTAIESDSLQSDLAFIDEQVPNFQNFANQEIPWKIRLARAQTLEIWTQMDTPEGLQARIEQILSEFEALDMPVSRVKIVNIDILLLQGRLEDAIHSARTDLFSESVLRHLAHKDRFVTPLYAEFAADPGIAADLDRWREDIATMREEVRVYLAENE